MAKKLFLQFLKAMRIKPLLSAHENIVPGVIIEKKKKEGLVDVTKNQY